MIFRELWRTRSHYPILRVSHCTQRNSLFFSICNLQWVIYPIDVSCKMSEILAKCLAKHLIFLLSLFFRLIVSEFPAKKVDLFHYQHLAMITKKGMEKSMKWTPLMQEGVFCALRRCKIVSVDCRLVDEQTTFKKVQAHRKRFFKWSKRVSFLLGCT